MNIVVGIVLAFALLVYVALYLDWLIRPIRPIGPIRPFRNLPAKAAAATAGNLKPQNLPR